MAELAHNPETGETFVWNPETGRYQPAFSGPAEAFAVGAGRTLTRMGRGIQSLLGGDRAALQARQQEDDRYLRAPQDQYRFAYGAGEMAPGLATAPLGMTAAMAGRLGLMQSAALSGALGGGEGAITLDPTGQQIDNALLGLAGGVAGEGVGRMAGRVVNAIQGAGRSLARSAPSEFLERRGLQALPSERLNVAGQNVDPLRRVEQGAQTGVFTPRIFGEIAQERTDLMNQAAARSIGLQGLPADADGLTQSVLSDASERISDGFQAIVRDAYENGLPRVFPVNEELAGRIANTRGQVRSLMERNRFRGLTGDAELGGNFQLQGDEIMIARRALAQDAANAAGKGQYELAEDIFADVDMLDRVFAEALGEDGAGLIERHALLREQYRNLENLLRPGVIGPDNNVRAGALNRALGQRRGYGRAYQMGRDSEFLPETQELFNVTRNLASPELAPFRSSGTAENQAMRDLAGAVGQAVADPVGGGVGLGLRVAAPLTMSAVGGTSRLANIAGGALLPGGSVAGRIGGETGPGLLEALIAERYLGSDDEGSN